MTEKRAAITGGIILLASLLTLISVCVYGAIRAANRERVSRYYIPNYPLMHPTVPPVWVTYKDVWL